MSEVKTKLYFINEYHEELFYQFLHKLGHYTGSRIDPEYGAFAYLMAATQKKSAIEYFDETGVYTTKLKRAIGLWSSGEIALAKLALQLFNSRFSNITTYDVFYSLGEAWGKAAIQGIKIRYKLGFE